MKFRGHETFSIRRGWLHKGIKAICDNSRVFVEKDIYPQDILGIGSSMVKALRYWLQATGLTSEAIGKGMTLTDFGHAIWNNDPYFQEDGTWLLVHYMLASNKDIATAWYFFFNELGNIEITRKDFFELMSYYSLNEGYDNKLSERVINDDFDCIIRTYYNSKRINDPEDNIVCPMSELGLITPIVKEGKIVHFSKKPPTKSINPYIILAVLINEKQKTNCDNDISILEIETGKCNIGKTFNLDNIAVSECLENLQNLELIKVVRTAGLDIVQLKTDLSFFDCINKYYESIKQ